MLLMVYKQRRLLERGVKALSVSVRSQLENQQNFTRESAPNKVSRNIWQLFRPEKSSNGVKTTTKTP